MRIHSDWQTGCIVIKFFFKKKFFVFSYLSQTLKIIKKLLKKFQ